MIDATLLLPSIEEASLNAILSGRAEADNFVDCGNLENEILRVVKESGDAELIKLFRENTHYYSPVICDLINTYIHGGGIVLSGVDLHRSVTPYFLSEGRIVNEAKKKLGEKRYAFLRSIGEKIKVKDRYHSLFKH